MITFDEAHGLVNKILKQLEIDVCIVSIRPFPDGWIFEYQDKEYINNCNYLYMLLDAPYILVDKNTKEIFFVYLKADKLELLLENYQTKSDHIANKTLIYCKNN